MCLLKNLVHFIFVNKITDYFCLWSIAGGVAYVSCSIFLSENRPAGKKKSNHGFKDFDFTVGPILGR